jgi:protein tyrosine phosphatase (PTP) superfamily phosphohydrolase (DUF442 family)
LLALGPFLLLIPACLGSAREPEDAAELRVPPPLELSGSAYEAALQVTLPAVPPEDLPGLDHVYHLSEQIISGAEPADAGALAQLAEWGVRTVVSVDGKVPDVAETEALGMRYVHIPIQYAGISEDEILKFAKTFRELEPPFYVHCFHGKHRGPAAAAIGRVVLDGLERERAIAEMRQWASTSGKYEGLYSAVAAAELPTPEATAEFAFDFPSEHPFEGLRASMVAMTRTWDHLEWFQDNDWELLAEHPDLAPVREAEQLVEQFDAAAQDANAATWTEGFHAFLGDGVRAATDLERALKQTPRDLPAAEAAMEALKVSCKECHRGYRNGGRSAARLR